MSKDFVHLRLKTEYSIKGSLVRIEEIMPRIKAMNMNALAITDEHNMYGYVRFYSEAIKHGIKPIIGCEVRFQNPFNDDLCSNIVLLAKTNHGMKNLFSILSNSTINGQEQGSPAFVSIQTLHDFKTGLIALSGSCGPVFYKQTDYLADECKYDEVLLVAEYFNELFGKGNFYLEITNDGEEDSYYFNPAMAKISRKLSIPLVVTNEIDYLSKKDRKCRDILYQINYKGTPLEGYKPYLYKLKNSYLKSPEEMYELNTKYKSALKTTVDIADRCNVTIKLKRYFQMPQIKQSDRQSEENLFETLVKKGLRKQYGNVSSVVKERAVSEIETIKKTKTAGYFLFLWDMVEYAKKKNILLSPGRGATAGSIVAYALGISQMDPIAYNLLFERFFNPINKIIPDIDIDVSSGRRNELLDYLLKKYGRDTVVKIGFMSRYNARRAVNEVGDVLGINKSKLDKVIKMIPFFLPNKKVSINNVIESSKNIRNLMDKDKDIASLLKCSSRIENLPCCESEHAAGIVVSADQLSVHAPLRRMNEDKLPVFQLEQDDLELLGLVKVDILEMRALSIIDNCLKMIKSESIVLPDLDKIPLDDVKTYKLLCRADTAGIFQLDRDSAKNLLNQIQPSNFSELAAIHALNRPGPIQNGMSDKFAQNKGCGSTKSDFMCDDISNILEETHGVLLYQEQVMQIAHLIGGLTFYESDLLWRSLVHYEFEALLPLKKKFISNATKILNQSDVVKAIFDMIEEFTPYTSCKSHAVSYALISYRMAYLKAHYCKHFERILLKG